MKILKISEKFHELFRKVSRSLITVEFAWTRLVFLSRKSPENHSEPFGAFRNLSKPFVDRNTERLPRDCHLTSKFNLVLWLVDLLRWIFTVGYLDSSLWIFTAGSLILYCSVSTTQPLELYHRISTSYVPPKFQSLDLLLISSSLPFVHRPGTFPMRVSAPNRTGWFTVKSRALCFSELEFPAMERHTETKNTQLHYGDWLWSLAVGFGYEVC